MESHQWLIVGTIAFAIVFILVIVKIQSVSSRDTTRNKPGNHTLRGDAADEE